MPVAEKQVKGLARSIQPDLQGGLVAWVFYNPRWKSLYARITPPDYRVFRGKPNVLGPQELCRLDITTHRTVEDCENEMREQLDLADEWLEAHRRHFVTKR